MITKDDVLYIAKLARLSFDEEKLEKFTKDMENIVGFSDKLNEVNTDGVVPTAHSNPKYNVFRKDETDNSFDRDEILKNSPQKDEEYFLVPNVVE